MGYNENMPKSISWAGMTFESWFENALQMEQNSTWDPFQHEFIICIDIMIDCDKDYGIPQNKNYS